MQYIKNQYGKSNLLSNHNLLRLLLLLNFSSLAYAEQKCDERIVASTPDENYIVDIEKGTVTDKKTNLMWQICSSGLTEASCSGGSSERYNWKDALKYAKDNTLAGFNNWRLPNIKELDSIIEIQCNNPAVNVNLFPATESSGYWSSSPNVNNSSSSWVIDFYNGNDVIDIDRANTQYVRLVRDID